MSGALCRSPSALRSAQAKATQQQPYLALAKSPLLWHALTVCYQAEAARLVPIHSMNSAVEVGNWWTLAGSHGFAHQRNLLGPACLTKSSVVNSLRAKDLVLVPSQTVFSYRCGLARHPCCQHWGVLWMMCLLWEAVEICWCSTENLVVQLQAVAQSYFWLRGLLFSTYLDLPIMA